MRKRDFLSTEELGPEGFSAILDLAARVKRGEVKGGLEGKIFAASFMDPSLRTRASFESAMFMHGGHMIVLEPGRGSWSMETELGAVMEGTAVEHLIETSRVLGRYADAIGLRVFPKGTEWVRERQDRIIKDFAAYSEKPVINLESARRHPCQGLADALTLREKLGDPKGKRFVLSWAWHPKPLPTAVPASAAIAAAQLGMDVVIARPQGYDLDPDDMAVIYQQAAANGGRVTLANSMSDATVGADAVYVKSWGSLQYFGRPEEEKQYRAGLRGWKMTVDGLKATKAGKGIVMHCLPVRRNVEIDDAVLDGPNSVVIDEAENRLHVQRALLLDLIGRK
ncbi:MAG: N-acetylornithine carbamoyltransferase [Planctomycetaceae bacterium]|nr:N-acetylornithine carbamoyltransferase [Gemmatimonadota bacterium]MDX2059777.1 N-acetylornithine carbamoyltransferase [Gemmatimonadales bacterium]NUN51648.1 N-acetylornithine carbamoyltransferase [Planctomycetaceae bacterium]